MISQAHVTIQPETMPGQVFYLVSAIRALRRGTPLLGERREVGAEGGI